MYIQVYPTVDTVLHSKITRMDDSTISFMDTIQAPKRVYAGFSFSRDIKPTNRELWAVGYKQGNYSLNNDTLKLHICTV